MRFTHFSSGLAVAVLAACSASTGSTTPTELVVENHPGSLVLESPARAAFIAQGSGGPIEVLGTGGSAATTVNGAAVKVAANGSFHATVKPTVGLNLITIVDGEARLESPFLYGKFVSPSQPVAHAVSVGIGRDGFGAKAPAASITTVLNRVLRDRNLVASLAGQSFSGSVTGATWQYDVSGGHNDATTVSLDTAAKGIAIAATGNGIVVEGTLTLKILGIPSTHATRLIVDTANVTGTAALSLDGATLGATMADAAISLDGFHWDAGDFGFPCCVDSIASNYLKPKIEDAIKTAIQEQVPAAAKIALGGVGLPKQLDLSAIGLKTPIPVSAQLDGGSFDGNASVLSASILFGGTYAPGTPGAKAPGFLPLGTPLSSLMRPAALAASFSVDAVNQLLFAAWGSGELSFATPASIGLTLTPSLPPMVSISAQGAVRFSIGELVVNKVGASAPLAAVTVIQDVVASADPTSLMLTASGDPTLSITFLADDSGQSGNSLIADAAKGQVKKLLSPFKMPLPAVALDALGANFAGQSLAIQALKIDVDAKSGQLGAEGAGTLVHP